MSQVVSSTAASNPLSFFSRKYLMRLSLSRTSRMSSTRLLVLSTITQTNWRCFFLRKFIDSQALDRLAGNRGRLLLLAFDVVVVPAGQRAFGELVQSSDIGDVGEVDQAGDVSEEPLGGMSARSDGRVSWGEVALTTLALVLRGADEEFDGLLAQREILDGRGIVTTVNRVAGVAALGTDGHLLERNDGEANRIGGGVTPLMHHSESWQVQGVGPEGQPVILAHFSPLRLSTSLNSLDSFLF